jgi:hypothetical protein
MSSNAAVPRSPELCEIIFDDGRRCHMSKCQDHAYYCYFHARRDNAARAEETAIGKITGALAGRSIDFDNLSSALAHTITALAEGHMDTKTAATIAYIGQSLVQSVNGAENLRLRSEAQSPAPSPVTTITPVTKCSTKCARKPFTMSRSESASKQRTLTPGE